MGYLDNTGLAHLWSKIKSALTGKLDTTGTAYKTSGIPYGECDSSSTSTVFTATVPGITSLYDGVCVLLKNGVETSASGFTININNLGAKPVYNSLATGNDETPTDPTRETTIFNINYTMLFVYSEDLVSGGAWICYRGYDSNTNTIGYQLRTNSGNLVAADTGYRYRIWLTSADGSKWVPINTSTSTNATTARTLNTRKIDPFGPIVYNSANGTTNANARPNVGTLWQQYTLTIGYSYVISLTAWDSVYLRCTPQTDGSVVMHDLTQSLPSTNDGYVYIYLGQAYSATAMELRVEHPVYYHDGTGIRAWIGRGIPTKTSDLINDSGYITDAGVTSFNGSTGAVTYTAPVTSVNGSTGAVTVQPNVQADWNETDSTAQSYIQNKPTIPPGSVVDTALSTTSENAVQNKVITNAMYQYRGEEATDLDNCLDDGVYFFTSTALHTPVANTGGTLIVTPGPGDYKMHWAIPRDADNASTIYFRQYNSNLVWTSWKAVAADGDYVPKSGGTFSGDVTFAQDKHVILTGPLGNTTTIQNQSWGSDVTVALPYTSGILALTSQLPTFEKRTITASNTSVATVSGLNLYTYGRPSSSEYLCVLFGRITAVNLTTSQTTVGTFSRSYAPSVAVGAATSWNSSRYNTNVTIGTTGTIAVRSNAAYTSGELYISATWVVVPPDEPEPF